MFRFVDSDNYFITRANALEGNVRLYRVVNGDRQQFATADAPVTSGEWHTLEATAVGTAFTVSWDGAQLITAHDLLYTKTPTNTMKIADYMHRAGMVKSDVKSWKDYFFPEIYDEKGS